VSTVAGVWIHFRSTARFSPSAIAAILRKYSGSALPYIVHLAGRAWWLSFRCFRIGAPIASALVRSSRGSLEQLHIPPIEYPKEPEPSLIGRIGHAPRHDCRDNQHGARRKRRRPYVRMLWGEQCAAPVEEMRIRYPVFSAPRAMRCRLRASVARQRTDDRQSNPRAQGLYKNDHRAPSSRSFPTLRAATD